MLPIDDYEDDNANGESVDGAARHCEKHGNEQKDEGEIWFAVGGLLEEFVK